MELTNALCGHKPGTSTPVSASLKLELPKLFASGLNATVLDALLFFMNLHFQMEDHIPVTKCATRAVINLICQAADWFRIQVWGPTIITWE